MAHSNRHEGLDADCWTLNSSFAPESKSERLLSINHNVLRLPVWNYRWSPPKNTPVKAFTLQSCSVDPGGFPLPTCRAPDSVNSELASRLNFLLFLGARNHRDEDEWRMVFTRPITHALLPRLAFFAIREGD